MEARKDRLCLENSREQAVSGMSEPKPHGGQALLSDNDGPGTRGRSSWMVPALLAVLCFGAKAMTHSPSRIWAGVKNNGPLGPF